VNKNTANDRNVELVQYIYDRVICPILFGRFFKSIHNSYNLIWKQIDFFYNFLDSFQSVQTDPKERRFHLQDSLDHVGFVQGVPLRGIENSSNL